MDEGDLTSAYYYGKQLVPMSSVDQIACKVSGTKGLTLLAVENRKRLDKKKFKSNVMMVCPQPNDAHATLAMRTLCKALEEDDSYMMAAYVQKNNGDAKLQTLLPHEHRGCPCLLMYPTAYNEDIKSLDFNRLPPSTELQDAATDTLMDAMDLDKNGPDFANPNKTYNPTLHYFRMALSERSKDKKKEKTALAPCPEAVYTAVMPPAELLADSKAGIEAFKMQHPTERVMENVEKKRSAFTLEDGPSSEEQAEKRIKLEAEVVVDGEDLTVASMMSKTPSEQLSVRIGEPMEDFEEMINRTDVALWSKAVKELTDLVHQLVMQSVRDMSYDKALSCVKGLRTHCVTKKDAVSYNSFVTSLKEAYEDGGRAAFWLSVKEAKLTLISSVDVSSSTVGQMEADNFFAETEAAPVEAPKASIEEDDLLDDFD